MAKSPDVANIWSRGRACFSFKKNYFDYENFGHLLTIFTQIKYHGIVELCVFMIF